MSDDVLDDEIRLVITKDENGTRELTVQESEKDFKKRAIMTHFARTPHYRGAEITRIAETAAGGIMLAGTSHERDQFGGDRRKGFTVSYSKFEVDKVMQRLKETESDHGVLYHE